MDTSLSYRYGSKMPGGECTMAGTQPESVRFWWGKPSMRDKRTSAGSLLISAMLLVVHAYRVYGTDVALVDDAFIFFRYAKHWAEGYGLVWNVGEPPVEGVSSLLYTALLALGFRLGVDVLLWATMLNLVLGLSILGLVFGLARGLNIASPYRHLALLLVAASADVAFWVGAGMDVILFTALLTLALWLVIQERWVGASVTFAVLSIARLDAVPLFLFTLFFLQWHRLGRASTPDARQPPPLAPFLIPYLLLFLPFYFARWIYFGWPLPNTFYAKTGGGILAWQEGLRYAGTFLRRPEVLTVGTLSILAAVSVKRWPFRYVGLVGLLLIVRAVAASEDWMPRFRLLVPLWPLLGVLAAAGLSVLARLYEKTRRNARREQALPLLASTLLVLIVVWPSLHYLSNRPWRLWRPLRLVEPMHASHYAMGLALRDVVCPGDTIALIAAGAAAYLNDDHTIIDMMGLNDVHIAHSPPVTYKGRWDAAHARLDVTYLLARAPEWIQLDTHLFSRPELQIREWMPPQILWGDARIRQAYEFFPLRVEVPTGLPRPRTGYIFFLHRKGSPICGTAQSGERSR